MKFVDLFINKIYDLSSRDSFNYSYVKWYPLIIAFGYTDSTNFGKFSKLSQQWLNQLKYFKFHRPMEDLIMKPNQIQSTSLGRSVVSSKTPLTLGCVSDCWRIFPPLKGRQEESIGNMVFYIFVSLMVDD